MSDELAQQLRRFAGGERSKAAHETRPFQHDLYQARAKTMDQAAARIENLAAEVTRLRGELNAANNDANKWCILQNKEQVLAEALTAKLATVTADKRLILEERDRTFALMLARAEAAEAALATARAAGVAEGLRMAVSPLEWNDCTTIYADGSGRKVAFGQAPLTNGYTVYESPAEGLHVVSGTTAFAAYHLPDLDAAKAAAQADYAEWIASALIPAPAKPAE